MYSIANILGPGSGLNAGLAQADAQASPPNKFGALVPLKHSLRSALDHLDGIEDIISLSPIGKKALEAPPLSGPKLAPIVPSNTLPAVNADEGFGYASFKFNLSFNSIEYSQRRLTSEVNGQGHYHQMAAVRYTAVSLQADISIKQTSQGGYDIASISVSFSAYSIYASSETIANDNGRFTSRTLESSYVSEQFNLNVRQLNDQQAGSSVLAAQYNHNSVSTAQRVTESTIDVRQSANAEENEAIASDPVEEVPLADELSPDEAVTTPPESADENEPASSFAPTFSVNPARFLFAHSSAMSLTSYHMSRVKLIDGQFASRETIQQNQFELNISQILTDRVVSGYAAQADQLDLAQRLIAQA